MQIQISTNEGYTVVGVDGRIDTVTAGEFDARISEYTGKANPKVIIDCSNLNYISSSGLRVFLMAQKKVMANGGKLKICSLQPAIREIFDISGFSNILSLSDDVKAAASE
jgi:anti-anti-sigma factor